MDKIELDWVITKRQFSDEAIESHKGAFDEDFWNIQHVSWVSVHKKSKAESFQHFFNRFEEKRKKDDSIQLRCYIKINGISLEDYPEIREVCNPPFRGFKSIFELANLRITLGVLSLDDISILNVVLNKILSEKEVVCKENEKAYWQDDLESNYLPLFICRCTDLYCGSYGTYISADEKSFTWEWEINHIKRKFKFKRSQYLNQFLEYRKFINECSKHQRVLDEIEEAKFFDRYPTQRLRFYAKSGNYFIHWDELY